MMRARCSGAAAPALRAWYTVRHHAQLCRVQNLRFPFAGPMPYRLIERIVKLRIEQDRAKARSKKKAR